jgi:hypothetical protein
MAAPKNTPETTTDILKREYQLYLEASDSNDTLAIESFMSPSCWQISRQDPAWNLANRNEIMQILISMRDPNEKPEDKVRGNVEMRALTQEEKDTIPEEQKEQALREGWEGLHVVLESPDPKGMRVHVNYYWRKEGEAWVQCLHDLLWLGPMDPEAKNDVGSSVFGTK